jgi:hypothetical protein
VLEVLESVLSQRHDVFHKLPQLTVALRQKVSSEHYVTTRVPSVWHHVQALEEDIEEDIQNLLCADLSDLADLSLGIILLGLKRLLPLHKLYCLLIINPCPVQVCPFLEGMLHSALEPNVDPASIVDVRLIIRCAGGCWFQFEIWLKV